MSNATESKIAATAIPHPIWCAEKIDKYGHEYHESHQLHAELQHYEVGFSVAVERSAEAEPNGAPTRLVARIQGRAMAADMEFVMSESETEALIGILTKQLANLRLYAEWRANGVNT